MIRFFKLTVYSNFFVLHNIPLQQMTSLVDNKKKTPWSFEQKKPHVQGASVPWSSQRNINKNTKTFLGLLKTESSEYL